MQQLSRGIQDLELNLTGLQQKVLIDYLEILVKWNKAYNLTAIKNLDEMVTHHLLDSLSIARFIKGKNILDVGTGAGFPGIPLAVCFPDKQFVLLDSNGKKIRFITQASYQLTITNVKLVQDRIENYKPNDCFNTITTRAFADLNTCINSTRHLLCDNGQLLMQKGMLPEDEIAEYQGSIISHSLSVPGMQKQRHLCIFNAQCSL